MSGMGFFRRVARTSRVLVAVSHRDELFGRAARRETVDLHGKFATVEHRRQHTRRARYPEALLNA